MQHQYEAIQRLVAEATTDAFSVTLALAGSRRAAPTGSIEALTRLTARLDAMAEEVLRLSAAPVHVPFVAKEASPETPEERLAREQTAEIARLQQEYRRLTDPAWAKPERQPNKTPRLTVSGRPARSRQEIAAEVRAFVGDPTKVKLYIASEDQHAELERRVQRTVTAMYQDQFGPKVERYPR